MSRKAAFVLASTDHGTLIVNRMDYAFKSPTEGYGVGFQLLETCTYDPNEGRALGQLLMLRRQHFGDGVVAVDCGANIGVLTVEWARQMTGWGSVVAIEAQKWVYHALGGNVALNNLFNVDVIHAAVGGENGALDVPVPDYTRPGSFGSLELRQSDDNEDIGQPVDYTHTKPVPMITLDSLALPRVDLLKLDVEGMELEALSGATRLLSQHPVVFVETLKAPPGAVEGLLAQRGYDTFPMGLGVLAVHPSDPVRQQIRAS